MADKEKRQWGTGSIVHEKHGLAIRWPEYVLDAEGKKRRKMRYEFLGAVTEQRAGKELIKRLAAYAGPRIELAIPTFSEHTERWERDILPHYKPSVQLGHGGILQAQLVPRFGSWRLSDISTAAVQAYITDLREAGYAPHSIHHYHEVLRVVMREAITWYGLEKNPAVGVRLPKLRPAREQWALTAEQCGKLIGKLQTKPRAMVALAIVSGMRRGELLALRWKHFNEHQGEIQITEAYYRGHLDTPKTEAGIRKIHVDRWVAGLLDDWRRRSKRTAAEDLVFGTRTGKAENPGNVLRRQVFPACDALKISRATWLTFRRTFSTLAHMNGVPAKTIADIMGHANVDIQFVYIQSVDGAKREAAGRIEGELSRFCPDDSQGSLSFVN